MVVVVVVAVVVAVVSRSVEVIGNDTEGHEGATGVSWSGVSEVVGLYVYVQRWCWWRRR